MVSLKKLLNSNYLLIMDNRRINVKKLFTNLGFLSLFITSSHSNSVEMDINNGKQTIISNRIKIQSRRNELSNIPNNYLEPPYIYSYDKPIFLADNDNNNSNVLISEIIIEAVSYTHLTLPTIYSV